VSIRVPLKYTRLHVRARAPLKVRIVYSKSSSPFLLPSLRISNRSVALGCVDKWSSGHFGHWRRNHETKLEPSPPNHSSKTRKYLSSFHTASRLAFFATAGLSSRKAVTAGRIMLPPWSAKP